MSTTVAEAAADLGVAEKLDGFRATQIGDEALQAYVASGEMPTAAVGELAVADGETALDRSRAAVDAARVATGFYLAHC